jgi:hypothetical protein
MRALRFVPIALAVGVVALPANAGANHRQPCAVRHGWKLVARDAQAVVIRLPGAQAPTYKYCSLIGARRFNSLLFVPAPLRGPDFAPVDYLQLKGRYVAVEQGGALLLLRDTRTGAKASVISWSFSGGQPVLSRHGVAAWVVGIPDGKTMTWNVVALTVSHGAQILDSGSTLNLANLQLYDCAASCPSNAVIVAWTDNGEQRYAQVSP